ncbi:MAG: valine--tRNA ligase [Dehalococcoidia bacterium]
MSDTTPEGKRDETGEGAMPKTYDPSSVEERLYKQWEDGGYFKPSDGDREPFVIIMPPPNLTGELHLGHALMDTVEDILVRWHRMRGHPTLWLPGIDHAAIAVHVLMERGLAKEGLTRQEIGREAFLERTWDFVNKSRARIFDQHKRLGASADWSRETFTMDPGPARAVRAAFYDFYQRGLIYRGERMINWCPRCQTALSDLEVDHQEEQGFLWHVRYPIINDAGEPTGDYITIATTRPETIVADTAIAVHPEDERYRAFIGRKARLPIIGRELIIVGDEAIEREFGTGALKVTPGHDPVDFEIGQRHGLPIVNALNLDGTMNHEAGPYAGMDRFVCRDAIVRDLDEQGFLVKTEPYAHSVGHCDRCDAIVEPMISEQWFVAVNKEFAPGRSLAGEALKVVNDGLIEFVPERFTKTYTNWMENLRDWCISRQLWWGHRIPVWYCDACNATIVPPPDIEEPATCESCGGAELRQDDDTLDTWFSSGLWPVSTLGWPDDTDELRRFYPTTVMETGYEIIFFWVARMIMMCLAAMDGRRDTLEERIPFRYVYLHGMVRDEHGAKMSKTKGNVVDPLELVEKYGTDALRFSLITGGGTGQDQRLWEDKVEAGRNFANKLWNAGRFVISQLPEGETHVPPSADMRTSWAVEDRWILSRLSRVTAEVEQLTRDFQLNEAARRIYDFLWGEYCDWYVEMAKVRLRQEQGTGSKEQGPSPLPVLVHVLETGLRLLHPYMPYVTEELWQRLRPFAAEPPSEMLIVAPYPKADPALEDADAEIQVEGLIDLIRQIRDIRSVHKIPAGEWIPSVKYTAITSEVMSATLPDFDRRNGLVLTALRESAAIVRQLARVQAVEQGGHLGEGIKAHLQRDQRGRVRFVAAGLDVLLVLPSSQDASAERARLEKEIAETEGYVARLNGKLGNEQFRSRAPADVVASEEERLAAAQGRLDGLRRALGELA